MASGDYPICTCGRTTSGGAGCPAHSVKYQPVDHYIGGMYKNPVVFSEWPDQCPDPDLMREGYEAVSKVVSCPECGQVTDIEYDGPVPQQNNDDCPVDCQTRAGRSGANPLIVSMSATFDRCLSIAAAKNADYAASEDVFRNFKRAEMVGVSVERGILVRLTDKVCRIANLLDKEPDVAEERVVDSIEDAINYLAILKAYMDAEGSVGD
jgi:hypothetical protein